MGRLNEWEGSHARCLWPILVAYLWVGGTACFNSGVTPRTADLLDPGEIGGGFNFTVLTYAPGKITLDDGDIVTGNSGKRAIIHPLSWLVIHGINSQGWFRVGLPAGFEVGATIGGQQLGGELRYALLDEDAGAPVSLVIGGSAMWRVASKISAPWLGFNVDLSRRFERYTSIFNIALTCGPEDHAMRLSEAQNSDCGALGDEGCSAYGPPRHYIVSQRELRLATPIGVGIKNRDTGGDFIVSLVPYFNLWSDHDGATMECWGCSQYTPVAFEERWGVHLTFGYQFSGGH